MPNYSLFGELQFVGPNLAKERMMKIYEIDTEFIISIIHKTLMRLKVSLNLDNNQVWF